MCSYKRKDDERVLQKRKKVWLRYKIIEDAANSISYTQNHATRSWLCGPRDCSMINTIVKLLSDRMFCVANHSRSLGEPTGVGAARTRLAVLVARRSSRGALVTSESVESA